MSDSSKYQITIKSANQKVDDYVTICESIWTVRRLKQHISETHINKPNIEDQRLIYAGNLLKDSLTLKQVFLRDSLCTDLTNSSKTDFTIHLVCTQKVIISSNQQSSNKNAMPAARSATPRANGLISSSSRSSNPSVQIPSQSNPAEFSRNNPMASNATNVNASSNNSDVPVVTSSLLNNIFSFPSASQNSSTPTATRTEMTQLWMQSEQMRQQLALFQQMADLVAAQLVAVARNNGNPTSLPTTTNDIASQTSDNNANAPALDDHHHFRIEDAREARDIPVAQPAIGQAQQNDVIDWVYCSIKAVVLMAAIFLHASIFRILTILGLISIAVFFNRRSTRRTVPNRREGPEAPQGPIDLGIREPAANDPDPTPDDRGANENHSEASQGRMSLIKFCYLVVTDFLASLLPE